MRKQVSLFLVVHCRILILGAPMAVRLTSNSLASYCRLSKGHFRHVAFFTVGTSVTMVTKLQLLGAEKWPQQLFPDMAKKGKSPLMVVHLLTPKICPVPNMPQSRSLLKSFQYALSR